MNGELLPPRTWDVEPAASYSSSGRPSGSAKATKRRPVNSSTRTGYGHTQCFQLLLAGRHIVHLKRQVAQALGLGPRRARRRTGRREQLNLRAIGQGQSFQELRSARKCSPPPSAPGTRCKSAATRRHPEAMMAAWWMRLSVSMGMRPRQKLGCPTTGQRLPAPAHTAPRYFF